MEHGEHTLELMDLDQVVPGLQQVTVILTMSVYSEFLVLQEGSIECFCLEKECSGHSLVRILHLCLEPTVRSYTCWLLSATASQTSLSC